MIPGNTLEKSIFTDGLQVDHLSENTVGHGNRLQGISNPTAYPVLAGDVGEVQENNGSATLTTATALAITSITLTPGVWDISGMASFSGATMTDYPRINILSTPNTISGVTLGVNSVYAPMLTGQYVCLALTPRKVAVTTTTTYYLNAWATFSAGSPIAYCGIHAVRIA